MIKLRPVKKEQRPNITVKEYAEYRRHLTNNLGYYCSYCERRIEHNIGIEHIKPKSINKNLELNWRNLLLACVNCNSTKGNKPIDLRNYLWPHLDNTAKSFTYIVGGIIKILPNISDKSKVLAKNTIELVGLDKMPSSDISVNSQETDNRWKFRMETWDKAVELSNDLKINNTPIVRKLIIDIAIAKGYFSVWMSVFDNDIDMKRDLVNAFIGTDANCYDTNSFLLLPKGRI